MLILLFVYAFVIIREVCCCLLRWLYTYFA